MISNYCKIPVISPGLIFVQKAFLLGLFWGELIFGEACNRKEFCISKWVGLDNKNSLKHYENSPKQLALTVHGFILGRLIIGRIFASQIWRLIFFFWGGGGGAFYQNVMVLFLYFLCFTVILQSQRELQIKLIWNHFDLKIILTYNICTVVHIQLKWYIADTKLTKLALYRSLWKRHVPHNSWTAREAAMSCKSSIDVTWTITAFCWTTEWEEGRTVN